MQRCFLSGEIGNGGANTALNHLHAVMNLLACASGRVHCVLSLLLPRYKGVCDFFTVGRAEKL